MCCRVAGVVGERTLRATARFPINFFLYTLQIVSFHQFTYVCKYLFFTSTAVQLYELYI